MIYSATKTNLSEAELVSPLLVKINMDIDAPAHSLYAVFPLNNYEDNLKMDELFYIKVYDDENKTIVFDGIIDKQIIEFSTDGLVLKIYARSFASKLLDNEAMPQIYYAPSIKNIFDNHVKPYGFNGIVGSNTDFASEFQVVKGMSEWDVLYTFCTEYLNCFPLVTASRMIDISNKKDYKNLYFSNDQNSINYTHITKDILHLKPISEINVRCSKNGAYSTKVTNKTAIQKGIERKRYLNIYNSKKPVNDCETIIFKSNRDSYEINLNCPGPITFDLYDKAIVDDKFIGYIPGLFVAGIKYTLEDDKQITKLKLKKEN